MKKKDDLQDEIRLLMNPGAAKELASLSPTFQQFLIRWVDLRDMAILDETKTFIQNLYEKDNEELCKNVANIVSCQLAETLSPFYQRVSDIASSIEGINKSMEDMKLRLVKDEAILINIDHRVTKLEKSYYKYSSFIWTVARNFVTAAVSISVAIILILEIHSRMR